MGHGKGDFGNITGDLRDLQASYLDRGHRFGVSLWAVQTVFNSRSQMYWAFGSGGADAPIAIDSAAAQFELFISGAWRSPTATSIVNGNVLAVYAFDITAATNYRILTQPSGLVLTSGGTLRLPANGVPVIVNIGLVPTGSVDVSSVAVVAGGATTWTFASHVTGTDNPQTELQLKIAGNWVSPLTTVITSNNAVCTYSADATAATDYRINTAPANLAFATGGPVTVPSSGTPSVPPTGIAVTSVAFSMHSKGAMYFLWTFASALTYTDLGGGSFIATGLQIDGADPILPATDLGGNVYQIKYTDTSVTTGATYLVQSQPAAVSSALAVGATGLTT